MLSTRPYAKIQIWPNNLSLNTIKNMPEKADMATPRILVSDFIKLIISFLFLWDSRRGG